MEHPSTPVATADGSSGSPADPRCFPTGWFVIAFSSELRPGQLESKRVFGKDVVLYRTASGVACVADAHCPHLGAHLGKGGSVAGESIRCGFHGFCFSTAGQCTATGYGTAPPTGAVLKTWPVQEKNGVVLIHHSPRGSEPTWEVPEVATDGWTPLRGHTLKLKVHPLDVFENGVDLGHFPFVHGYSSIQADGEVEFGYPTMRARYSMDRSTRFGPKMSSLRLEYEIDQYGLGYDIITSHEVSFGLRTRHFIMPIPTDTMSCEVRLGVSLSTHEEDLHRLLSRLPSRLLDATLARIVLRAFVKDHLQDVPFWTDRAYIRHPPLARGDGPIPRYRRWATQFLDDADLAPQGQPPFAPDERVVPG